MSKNITTPWTFKDGRDYVLSLTVMEHPSLNTSLSIKLSDKITAEEWSCSYDSKCTAKSLIHQLKTALIRLSDSLLLTHK